MTTATRTHSSASHNRDQSHAHHAEVSAESHSLLDRLSHSAVGEETKEIVGKLRANLEALKESAEAAHEQLQAGFHATEKKIRQNPWTAVGVTAAAGIIIGFLLGHRRR
jgi:ElaB/YqjD/DUF883 family membrane-anchored ribosome-binding protein